MKLSSYIIVLFLLNLFIASNILAQDCKKFHLYGTCMQYPGPYFKMEGQSRSNVIGVGDKLTYNVIFYGERKYKLIFCATDMFNPVKYVMTDYMTKELIYDSTNDSYPETIELAIENTRRILIEVSVLALKAEKEKIDNYFGCVGFLVYYKPDTKK
jgi:hypothetical protein